MRRFLENRDERLRQVLGQGTQPQAGDRLREDRKGPGNHCLTTSKDLCFAHRAASDE